MAAVDRRSMNSPDETRTFDNGKLDVVKLDRATVGLAELQPGWRWSDHIKPIAGTESCQGNHLGYVISGHLHVVMDDGAEAELSPGDAYAIPPGHDAWVVGDEPLRAVEFDTQTAETYAKG
jgi:quercetin dioxygenase-like cupin family protein